MQTEWIRAFVLLKEKMNFTEAAEEMYVSPSSFSKYIKALEGALGVTLIDRSRHRLCLTSEGEALYPHALRIVEECQAMYQSAERLSGKENHILHISVSAAANTAVYIRHILTFFEEHPKLLLSLHEYDIKDARNAFLDGDLDMVIGYTGAFSDLSSTAAGKDLSVLVLRQEELFYADGSAKDRTPITLAKAVSDRLILHQNTCTEILNLLSYYGVDPDSVRPVVTTTSMDVLKAYLLSGTARSLLSLSALKALNLENRITLTPIVERPTLSLGILCRSTLSKAGKALLEYLRETCGIPGLI